MQEPQVDILLATFNGSEYVEAQIRSIQQQTHSSWRLLVSDDCSADETLSIVEEMAQKDARIRIVSRGVRHGSAKANFFALMSHAEAPYVMLCDQDDYWLPEKVAFSVKGLISLEAGEADVPCMVYTDLTVVDDDLEVLSDSLLGLTGARTPQEELHRCLVDNKAWGCTIAANRALIQRAALLQETSAVVMHDAWLRMVALALGRVRFLDKPTLLYRQHTDNVVGVQGFSLLRAARGFSFEKSVAWWRKISECASLLLRYYGSEMAEGQCEFLRECENLYALAPMQRVAFLVRHDMCVDRLTERVAQLLVVALSPRLTEPPLTKEFGSAGGDAGK